MNHEYIAMRIMPIITWIVMHPHMSYIFEEEELLYHTVQDFWGFMRIYMNCTATNKFAKTLWESLRITENHKNCLRIAKNQAGISWESWELLKNHQEMLDNWSRITSITQGSWESLKNCQNCSRITENHFRIMRFAWESQKIAENHSIITRITRDYVNQILKWFSN